MTVTLLRIFLRPTYLFIVFTTLSFWSVVQVTASAIAQTAGSPSSANVPNQTGSESQQNGAPAAAPPGDHSPGRHALKPNTLGPEETKRLRDSRPLDPHLLPSQLQHSVTGVSEPAQPRNSHFEDKERHD